MWRQITVRNDELKEKNSILQPLQANQDAISERQNDLFE